ncbi:MAG TPA: glycine cleavage system aminomethyltransferase GcvT [Longimicrobiales bacterium]
MEDTLKRTPLFAEHEAAGAKLIPFAGYMMPVQYPSGIVAEHNAVRTACGLFDVSHMGEIFVLGPQALDLVQRVTTNDVSKVAVGQAQYGVICRPDGGAVDDCIVYRFEDRYMIVVNASNKDKDYEWIVSNRGDLECEINDNSDDYALIAIQGPQSQRVLERLTETDLDSIRYYHFARGSVAGHEAIISRTGYTGEDGFELYIASGDAVSVWRRLLEVGASEGLQPAGLGARDSLRLEMGYALYGNDIDDRRTPLEAGLGWVVKLDKGDFIGRDALVKLKEQGVREKLVGFVLKDRGFPRHGYGVRVNGELSGEVTSGIHSPSLGQGIGMAYVPAEFSKAGTTIEIMVRDKAVEAEIVRPPFYKEGSVRK